MNNVIDFFTSALPWIVIGVFLAVAAVSINLKEKGKNTDIIFKVFPAVTFFALSIVDYSKGAKSSGTTWLVLSIFYLVLCLQNKKKS